jgi:hypothetical protein
MLPRIFPVSISGGEPQKRGLVATQLTLISMMKVGTVTQCPFKLSNNSGKFKKLYDGKSKNRCHFAALKK